MSLIRLFVMALFVMVLSAGCTPPGSENDTETWREFSAKMRVAHSTRKALLIGCVDAEGDTTYWEVRWRKP